MRIEFGNLLARVVAATEQERQWLRDYLAFEDEQAYFRRGRRPGDNKIRLYNLLTHTFPSGLLPLVRRTGAEQGYTVEVHDRRVLPCSPNPHADVSWLRDYQREAVERVEAETRGIMWLPTGCLAGDTEIAINRGGKSFKIRLDALVARFNGGRVTWGSGTRRSSEQGAGMRWRAGIPTLVRSRAEDGHVRLRELAAAVYSGVKTTYTVKTASGKQLRATADHYFMTPDGWRRLRDLVPGNRLLVDGGRQTTRKPKLQYRVISNLWEHPFAGRRGVRRGKGGYSVPQHRIVAEAVANGMPVAEFVDCVRAGDLAGLAFLNPQEWVVHHRDANPLNNDPVNLEVLTHYEHSRRHGQVSSWRNVTAKTVEDEITSIERFGDEPTYDLTMAAEPRNFLANGIVVHNSGKTIFAAALTKRLPCRWLFLVHKADLLHQTAAKYLEFCGLRAGLFGDGQQTKPEAGANLIVATYQTLAASLRRPDTSAGRYAAALLASAEGLIVDECHVAPAATFAGIIKQTRNAYYRVGMSGTPLARGDRRSVYALAHLGPVIYRLPTTELIQSGVLAAPEIVMTTVTQDSQAATIQGVYGDLIVRSPQRNRQVVADTVSISKPALLFVKEIAHGRMLTERLLKAGLRAVFVWGAKSTTERRTAITRLEQNDLDVIVCSKVFVEGVDIPAVMGLVNAAGGKSVIELLQRLGRGMRASNSAGQHIKSQFQVRDYLDQGHRWPERHAKRRLRAYRQEGYTVEIR